MSEPDAVAELIARQQITDVLYRYARGVDRLDLPAVQDCYWPDAIDYHGAYHGPASGLVVDIAERHATIDSSQHYISNVLIDFDDPDTARVESYCLCFLRQQRSEGSQAQDITIVRCRYIDRFDRREGQWRVGARVVAYDELQQTSVTDSVDPACAISRRDAQDWVYRRRPWRHWTAWKVGGSDGQKMDGPGRPTAQNP